LNFSGIGRAHAFFIFFYTHARPLMEKLANEVLQLRDTGAVYQVFHAQDKAFLFSKSWGARRHCEPTSLPWGLGYLQLPVFGYDLEAGGGSKSFVVASYERFHDVYTSTPPKQRFYYELVQEARTHARFSFSFSLILSLRIYLVTCTWMPNTYVP
jgi:hypothetical protein